METPATISLRKFTKGDQPAPPEPVTGEEPQLYTRLEQEETTVGGAIYGAAHKYKLGKKAKPVSAAAGGKNRVNIIKSKKTEEFDVALAPEDLELSEAELKKKYENVLKEKEKEKRQKQDVATEVESITRKRKANKDKDKERKKKKKKYDDYKF
eukprot:TRINITY_DN6905_c0_g3_i1.p1 TRINITY_DN6905_c0_g3~~TRINITY_DN6905_c0_g3_i1.p1  ORF type:complete len:154 (+),score=38.31 TRINITY_DN6905_c0_g3_i1:274-735(+)